MQYVNLTLDLFDGSGQPVTGGRCQFAPTTPLTAPGQIIAAKVEVAMAPAGPTTVALVATDNAGVTPAGWWWTMAWIDPVGAGSATAALTRLFFLRYADGPSQALSAAPLAGVAFLPGALSLLGGTLTGPLDMDGNPLTGLPDGTAADGAATYGQLLAVASADLPVLGPSRPVPWRAASAIKTIFAAGHGWVTTGAGVGSANLNDTTTYLRGTQCATVTTNGSGAQAALSLVAGPAMDLTGKMIRLTFKVDNITHLATLGFYAGSSGFGSNFLWQHFTATPGSLNYIQSGEWVTVCLSWADLYGAAG